MTESRLQNRQSNKLFNLFSASTMPVGDVETLRWLVSMRFKIGLLLLVVQTLSNLIDFSAPISTIGLYTVNCLYLSATLIYGLLLKGDRALRYASLIRQIQTPEKILLTTLAIYFFGGVLTPLFLLYPLAVIESIILMSPMIVYRTGALAILAYCSLTLLQVMQLLPVIPGFSGQPFGDQTITTTTYALYTLIVTSIIMLITYLANRVAYLIIQRNDKIDSQLQDLRALYNIANGLGNIMTEDEVLRYLATTLKSLQKASICLIGMVNREGRVEIKASLGVTADLLVKLRDISVTMPSLAAIFKHGEPILIEDTRLRPEFAALSLNGNTKSAYIYPIKVESKVLGAVSLSFDIPKLVTSQYHELMTVIVSQAGLAVERSRLIYDTQRMATEMSALYDVGLQTGSTLSRDEVIKRTAGNIERLLNPDAYYIALYDAETELISFEIFKEHGQIMPKMRASMESGGLTGRIIQTRAPLLIQDWLAHGDTYNAIAKKTGVDMLSYLGVPMMSQEKVVGVISVQSMEPLAFDSHDERLLLALAAQTAMALENAKLHEFAQDQAQYDSLTRVYNHGCFVDIVRKAVVNSDNDDSQVALIMLDIDYFKKYNDTYGHVAGDNVLRMVANALKSSVRETDYVGRWGGEEFGVLLTDAGVTEAKKVARTIRRAVSELYPVDGQGHLIPNPTISQGISSYPYPSATSQGLIAEADAALYHAKQHGRNQLIVYEASDLMQEATVTTGHLARILQAREALENMLSDSTGPLIPRDVSLVTTGTLSRHLAKNHDTTTTPRLN